MTSTIEGPSAATSPAEDDPGTQAARGHPRRATPPPRLRHPAVLVAGLVLVAGALPLAVALGVLAEPRWYPVSDYAQTELRVRDITNGHPPLLGLAGRIDGLGVQGTHPGPLSFYSLFPTYTLFGQHPWGLLAGAATLNLVAMGIAVGIAHRRGGRLAALGMAAALALLVRAYGEEKLVEPWNPYMPLLWWVVFLLAVWSVLDDDLPLLPVAVFAGSFCAQTHVSYLGLVPGLALVAVAVLLARAWRHRGDRDALARLLRWAVPSGVLLGLLWLPPVVEQIRGDPGNLAVVADAFSHPTQPRLGLGREALELWLTHLDVGTLLGHTRRSISAAPSGPVGPGMALLALWLAAVAATLLLSRDERSRPTLPRLHLVVAVALVLGLASITRIHGILYDYLLLWAWGTTILLLVATGWTAALVLRQWLPASRLAVGGAVALTATLVGASAAFTVDATRAEMPMHSAARFSQAVSPQVVEALESPDAPGGGPAGRYLFRWDADSFSLDWSAYGLLVELTRAGFDVGVEPRIAVPARPHRVRHPEQATAAINYVLGAEIDDWRALSEAVEVAYYEPRRPEDQDEYARVEAELVEGLRDAGLDELVPLVDVQLMSVSVDPRLPEALRPKISRLYELGLPVAVFVAPPDVEPLPGR